MTNDGANNILKLVFRWATDKKYLNNPTLQQGNKFREMHANPALRT